MVNGVGSITGSIKDLPVYQQYYDLYLQYKKEHNCTWTFEFWLQNAGYREYFLQQVENYIETGSTSGGDGQSANTLNASKYVAYGNSSLYQSQDEDTYYDFDFNSGTYTVYQGKEEVATVLGLTDPSTVDTLNFGYNSVNVTNYTFGNLSDGQDSTMSSAAPSRYSSRVSVVNQEFDIDYIMNALLMNPDDPQYQIAAGIFDDLVANMNQWCPPEDLAELDAVAAEHGTNSQEYKEKLKEILLKNLDEANEWVEGHDHLEYTNDVSMNISGSTDGSTQATTPEYNKTLLLENAGLSKEYGDGSWSGSNHWDDDTEDESALNDAKNHAEQILNAIISQLQSQLGEAWTQDMYVYCVDLKNELVQDKTYVDYHHDGHGMWKDGSSNGTVDTDGLIDTFLSKFDQKCKNGGKTDEEVAAEKEAKKNGYKSLNDLDFNSVASDKGIKDATVVPTGTNQYAEIREKAENSIITPLKNEIISKMQGKNIPDSELQELLNAAADVVLANPQNWATTSNNYTYTIDADKLINLYEEQVKTGIKSKGYEF